MTITRIGVRLLALTVLATVTACGSTGTTAPVTSTSTVATTPGDYRVPDNMRTSTVVWSADDGIDLLGEYGTLTRGAVEANRVALGSGLDQSYPGYARAIDRKTVDHYTQFGSDDAPAYGTVYYHISGIEPTENGFVAHTCYQNSNIAYVAGDGRYVRTVYSGAMGSKITFERAEPSTSTSTSSQTTPAATTTADPDATGQPHWQAPTYDVFVGWNIIRGGWSGQDHTLACRQWGQQFATDAPDLGTAEIRSDTPPDTLPAYPGW
ncbi:MAG: hypothetical protein WAX14_01475 [Rhodococcus sp. (in: high G+C Gram-positive bacteria)]|uniref:hypothetical protein n=1 Tax=Rhodococcus sp. TaxID=1831 RepID=UPI003BB70FA4